MVCPLHTVPYRHTNRLFVVNELSTTIDLESTLVRAEALFRRFQRTVEAIDKKSNFPAPKIRHRPTQNASLGGVQLMRPISPASPPSPNATASTSGVDAVTVNSTTSGSTSTLSRGNVPNKSNDNGKGKAVASEGRASAELEEQRPKVISPELRALLSRKVEILPRNVVRKEGEGLLSLKK